MNGFLLKYFRKVKKKNIGLALGGGGTRGFAIFPILKNIQDSGIKFSYVSGTSVGAIIGAYYCINGEVDSLYRLLLEYKKKDWLKLLDLSYKFGRPLIRGRKIYDFLYSIFKDKTFDDLETPLIIAATNLDSGNIDYISNGKLIDAIMASIAYPLIMPPYFINGCNYIDGGLLDILPFEALFKKKIKKVVAINLSNLVKQKGVMYDNVFHLLQRSFEIVFNEAFKRRLPDKKKIFIFNPIFEKSLAGIWDINAIKKHYNSGKKEWELKKNDFLDWL
jgi:NTE family protein